MTKKKTTKKTQALAVIEGEVVDLNKTFLTQLKAPGPVARSQALFLQAFINNACNISMAARKVNITRQTYYDWRNTYPSFLAVADEIFEAQIDLAESALKTNISLGREASIFFFLCNRRPDRWAHIQKLEHTGPKGEPIKVYMNIDQEKV